MTVTVPGHPLHFQTVCVDCVGVLGITGCAYRDGQPVEYVWGTAIPPRGWKGRRLTPEELLQTVSSAGYRLAPRPREPERLDISKLVDELWLPPTAADEAA